VRTCGRAKDRSLAEGGAEEAREHRNPAACKRHRTLHVAYKHALRFVGAFTWCPSSIGLCILTGSLRRAIMRDAHMACTLRALHGTRLGLRGSKRGSDREKERGGEEVAEESRNKDAAGARLRPGERAEHDGRRESLVRKL